MVKQNSFMRVPHVTTLLGISRPTLWRWCAAGHFPKPYKIGVRVTAWCAGEVNAWIEQQKAVSK